MTVKGWVNQRCIGPNWPKFTSSLLLKSAKLRERLSTIIKATGKIDQSELQNRFQSTLSPSKKPKEPIACRLNIGYSGRLFTRTTNRRRRLSHPRYLAKDQALTLPKRVVRPTRSIRFKRWVNNLTMMSFKARKPVFLVLPLLISILSRICPFNSPQRRKRHSN